MSTTIVRQQSRTQVINSQTGLTLVKSTQGGSLLVQGSRGATGLSAKVSLGVSVGGPFLRRSAILPAPILLSGSGVFTAAASHGRAFSPCTAISVWSVTKNGTFASEGSATDLEVSAALFATITFPAGPGPAVFNYPTGGSFVDGDFLSFWESDSPDATQANTAITLSGD